MDALNRDAQNELNGRQKGRAARLRRLEAAGAPIADRAALARWLRDREDAASPGAVYHACTARVANGADRDLPQQGNLGCRVTRIPVDATYWPAGSEFSDLDEPVDEPFISVAFGTVGTGWMMPVSVDPADLSTEAEASQGEICAAAEQLIRRDLLERQGCYPTRAEAEAAAAGMLSARVVAKGERKAER